MNHIFPRYIPSAFRSLFIVFIPLLATFLSSCSDRRQMSAQLDMADRLMDHDSIQQAYELLSPDSARFAQASRSLSMRYMLTFFNVKDQLFVPLNDDSMMVEVENYYANHGNANEQTLSRYLLAACYRDMRLSSKAQQWALRAIEQADTTERNFDFRLLYKVESLLGNTYNASTSIATAIRSFQQAAYYANKANDSVRRNDAMLITANCYNDSGLHDKCIEMSKQILSLSKGDGLYAINTKSAAYLNLTQAYISKNMYDKALAMLDSIQALNPSICNDVVSDEMYYYYYPNKSRVLMCKGMCDSALVLSKREYSSSNPVHKYGAAKEISQIFFKLGQVDSAYAYLKVYDDYMDSVKLRDMDLSLQDFQNHFNIMQSRTQIDQSRLSAKIRGMIALVTIIVSLCVGVFLSLKVKYNKRLLLEKLQGKTEEYNRLQDYCKKMENKERDSSLVEAQLQQDLAQARQELSALSDVISPRSLYEDRLKALLQSDSMNMVLRKVKRTEILTSEDLTLMLEDLHKIVPNTADLLQNEFYVKDKNLQQLCLLVIYQVKTKDISRLLCWQPQLVSTNKARLNEHIFGEKSARNLDVNLLTFSPEMFKK